MVPRYLNVLLRIKIIVAKKDITPHQPRKTFIKVYCQKYLLVQFLHKLPFIDICLLASNIPMFA